jgi:hypothetical protein
MRTSLAPEAIAQLHAQAQAEQAPSQFVDPTRAASAVKVIKEHGEQWVSSVLLRDLGRRSRLRPEMPWLQDFELAVLLAAHKAEFEQLTSGW